MGLRGRGDITKPRKGLVTRSQDATVRTYGGGKYERKRILVLVEPQRGHMGLSGRRSLVILLRLTQICGEVSGRGGRVLVRQKGGGIRTGFVAPGPDCLKQRPS